MVFPDQAGLQAIVAPHDAAESLLFRLLYLDGAGLTHFERYDSEGGSVTQKVISYKIV
jgi:hypothetical protein